MDRRTLLTMSTLLLFGCSRGLNLAGGLTPGENGRVARIIDGDALVLDTGLTVRLAEVEAPRKAYREREADIFGDKAAELLAQAALGRQARLYYGGLSRDRYDRALAHLVVKDETGSDIWVNGFMIRQGGARVRTYADNCAKARELHRFEDEARQSGKGLWLHHDYSVLSPMNLSNAGRGLCLVEGVLSEMAEVAAGRSQASSASDGGLSVSLGYGMARAKERLSLKPGDHLRLRGAVRRGEDGVYLPLDHWPQI